MKNIITKYNNQNSILVISSYPEKGVVYSGKVCAVGGFAKNTVQSLQKTLQEKGEKRNIIVLTVTTGKQEMYVENDVLVVRCFQRNSMTSYVSMAKTLLQFNNIKDVLVEFEFASFGHVKTTGLFPLVLLLLRVLQKNTTLVLHQVLTNVSEIMGHIGVDKKSATAFSIRILLNLFYKTLVLFPKHIVVLEEIFKKRLVDLTNTNKVTVIPHGVDISMQRMPKNTARKILGIKQNETVLLYFGYLTWYKGADWLVKAAAGNKKIRLIVAGGKSFTQTGKAHYDKYVKQIYDVAKTCKNITITGFVNEKDMPLYFGAADLVVLPYRTMLSSSGPLSLTYSFGKPLLLSDRLLDYTLSLDYKEALAESGLSKKDIFFPLEKESFLKKVQGLTKSHVAKLETFSVLLGQKRTFAALSKTYIQLLTRESLPRFTARLPFRLSNSNYVMSVIKENS